MFKFTFPFLILFGLVISDQAFCTDTTPALVNTCLSGYKYDGHPMHLTEKEWKAKLSHDQFESLRKKKEDFPFNNSYFNSKGEGLYRCAGCDLALFSSVSKYDGNNGMASFSSPVCHENIDTKFNWNVFSKNKEVFCKKCEGYLGKVQHDDHSPTKKRYSINSASLKFAEQ